MSKVLEDLKNQQQTLLNQRSQMKDQLEACESGLDKIGFALQIQESMFKEEEAAEKEAAEKLAAELETSATPSEN